MLTIFGKDNKQTFDLRKENDNMGNKLVEILSAVTTSKEEITKEIVLLNFTVVTACIVEVAGSKGNQEWVLVDTGLENSADFIMEVAEERFGKGTRPNAIILTHGHFDHVGSAITLANHWDVPVYAHELELPFITGKKDYPAADPTVGGGMVAQMSPSFPHTSIDLGLRAVALPQNGTIPGMPGWQWVATPGHTPGHISLFRDGDGVLIVGDAFTTLKQESLLSVITQNEEISGPPKYLTTDWTNAKESIKRITALKPSIAIVSHGQPMMGDELAKHLELLTHHFEEIAVPEHGRFVD